MNERVTKFGGLAKGHEITGEYHPGDNSLSLTITMDREHWNKELRYLRAKLGHEEGLPIGCPIIRDIVALIQQSYAKQSTIKLFL